MGSLLGGFLKLWVRWTLRPEDISNRLAAAPGRVCYVLERASRADLAVLQNVCLAAALPRPTRRLLPAAKRAPGMRSEAHRAWFALERGVGFWRRRLDRRVPPLLPELTRALYADPSLEIVLVPVAVYWGRAPQKERSWLRLLLADERALPGRLRRALTVLFNGRSTLVQIADPMPMRALLEDTAPVDAARRVARLLRAQFARRRAAHVGPDLSHRRTVVTAVLRTRAVRAVLHQEMREHGITARQALERASALVEEIASNYSHAFVNIMSGVLRRLWTRLYDGVDLAHAATLEHAASGHEIVYVPCHRSHMDYILLSYAIYTQGYAIPHIAAGINLNIPVVGRFLRKGGAFFIRRSFRGNALYAVVFMQYLAAIMARGHPIEYFIEGGRSRTGKLLAPKTGMLSMTVRSYLRDPKRPLLFLPVYFAYERVMEAASYVSELQGKPKEKETIFQFLRALRRLREHFGRVHVNLGEPIALDALLDRAEPQWRAEQSELEARPGWVNPVVDHLAQHIMRNINAAAAVTPVSLLATVLLAAPGETLTRAALEAQLQLFVALLQAVPYSERVTVTPLAAGRMIEEGVELQLLAAPGADGFMRLNPATAASAAYYRNNILHLFALPALVAHGFAGDAPRELAAIQAGVAERYPAVAEDLFLRWTAAELPAVVLAMLRAMLSLGLLQADADETVWRARGDAAHVVQLASLARLAEALARPS